MSSPTKDLHEEKEHKESEGYGIGQPIKQAVDYVVDTIKEHQASLTDCKNPHDVTEDVEAYRIGEVVERAVDHVIEVIHERRASRPEEKKEEHHHHHHHHKPAGHAGSHSEHLLELIDKKS